ncbi:hypothetical protein B0H14DRAFT_2685670 [Mycena olivaceomarginata]|nr:hypothetical protein B0H14DRAFT_2685670 [Mycena olivaceomarginata]
MFSFTLARGVLDPIWFPWPLASASVCCIARFRSPLPIFLALNITKVCSSNSIRTSLGTNISGAASRRFLR